MTCGGKKDFVAWGSCDKLGAMKKKATPRKGVKASPAPKEVVDEFNAALEKDAEEWTRAFSAHVEDYEKRTGDAGEPLKPDSGHSQPRRKPGTP